MSRLKFPEGPISVVNPGPTTAIAVAAADNEVAGLNPVIHRSAAAKIVDIINKKVRAKIESIVLSSIEAFAYVILIT